MTTNSKGNQFQCWPLKKDGKVLLWSGLYTSVFFLFRTDCPSALIDLERYHWTYLSESYNKLVLDPWKDQGCYDTIADHLGYRLVINYQDSVFPDTIARDDSRYRAKIVIQNIGMGRIINNKTLKIVFMRNEMRNEFLITDPSADLRKVS